MESNPWDVPESPDELLESNPWDVPASPDELPELTPAEFVLPAAAVLALLPSACPQKRGRGRPPGTRGTPEQRAILRKFRAQEENTKSCKFVHGAWFHKTNSIESGMLVWFRFVVSF